MKIYNQNKTRLLNESEIDLEKGRLLDSKLFIARHEAIEGVPSKCIKEQIDELKSQGITVTRDSNNKFWNGNDQIVFKPAVPAQPAWSEYEDIKIYIPYSQEQLKKRRIAELKQLLFDSDYQAIKYAEGELSEEEFVATKALRRAWRAEINELEESINEV